MAAPERESLQPVFEAPQQNGARMLAPAGAAPGAKPPVVYLAPCLECWGWAGAQSSALRLLLYLGAFAGLVWVAVQLVGMDASLEGFLKWVDREPVVGGLAFVVVDVVAIVVLFPGVVFALGAGAIFGVVMGSLLVWVATCIGQTASFLLGRYLFRRMVVAWLAERFPRWPAVDDALSKEGWKLITLLRLSPLVPWNVLNYALSVTGVHMLPYTVSSAISIVPWNVTFVYFGSLARSVSEVLEGGAGPAGATSALVLGVSGVLLIVAVVYTTAIARRAVGEALGPGPPDLEEGQRLATVLEAVQLPGLKAKESGPERVVRGEGHLPGAEEGRGGAAHGQGGSRSLEQRQQRRPQGSPA